MIRGVQEGTQLAVAAMHSGTKEVELGVAATNQVGGSLQEIIDISDRVGEMVTHIATEQASATENVNMSTERISDIAAATASGALEATKALEDLANLAAEIQRQVGHFRLQSDGSFTQPASPGELRAHAAAGGR